MENTSPQNPSAGEDDQREDLHEQYGITRREHDHCEYLQQQLNAAYSKDEDYLRKLDGWRAYSRGKINDDQIRNPDLDFDQGKTTNNSNKVRANLCHSRFSQQGNLIAARNPEVAVSPAPRLNEEGYTKIRKFSKTLEIVLNHEIKSGDLKRQLRKQIRSTQETAGGWIKGYFQRDMWRDPLVEFRNDDAQDNIARLQAKLAQFNNGEIILHDEEINILMTEITQLQAGLSENKEIEIRRGFNFVKVHTDNIRIDTNIEEMADYAEADWIADGFFMPVDKVPEVFDLSSEEGQRRLQTARVYQSKEEAAKTTADGSKVDTKQTETQQPGRGETKAPEKGLVRVWEINHKRDRVVYTVIEGMKGYARQPWRPDKVSEHWYNLFFLQFNPTDKQRNPLSDTELIAPLVDEYNETRSNLREHRNKAVPARVGKKSEITVGDANKINSATPNELILIDGPDDDAKPIGNSIFQLPYAPIDPNLYETIPIVRDMDQVGGTIDLHSGAQVGQRTATAASIQNEGLQSRTSGKQDDIEEMTTHLAEHMAQVALQEMEYQEVVRICGEGAVWPGKPPAEPTAEEWMRIYQDPMYSFEDEDAWVNELDRLDIYKLCMIEIRAGSTGKPNTMAEQQKWMQLFPIFDAAIMQISQLRATGQNDLANAKIELLKETARRMDEKIDVEKWLPSNDQMMMPMMPNLPQGNPQGMPGGGGGMPGGGQPQQPQGLIQPNL